MSEQDIHNDGGENPDKERGDKEIFHAREYRLIPIGDESKEENDAIDLHELFLSIKANRALIYKITGAFLILGLFIALLSPVEYESEALLMPEMQDSESGAGGLLENYGGLLGLSGLGSMELSDSGTLSPEVYPKIVQSLTFQSELLQDSLYFSDIDTTLSLYSYFSHWYSPSFFELVEDYTLKLPQKFKTPKPLPARLSELFDREGLKRVSEEELEVIKDLRERIFIELDTETGVMVAKATLPDAAAAAQLNKTSINLLTDYLKNYRTQKAKEDLEFAEEQYEAGRKRFKEAQSDLAEFLDQNVNLSTAKARAQEQLLQAEFDLAYEIYNSVAQKRVEARMKVQEKTPAFKVLQSVNVPLESSGLHPVIIIILSGIAGLLFALFIIALQNVYLNLKEKY